MPPSGLLVLLCALEAFGLPFVLLSRCARVRRRVSSIAN